MKYQFLVYLILLSLSFETYSQDSNFNYGIKIGANFSEYTPDYKVENTTLDANFSGKFGYYLGGFTNIKVNNRFSLQSELLLSKNGTNVEYIVFVESAGTFPGQGSVPKEYEYNLNEFNLSLPISVRYELNDFLFAEAGLMFNYVIFVNQRIKNNPFVNTNGDFENNPEENIDRFDLAGLAGLGVRLSKNINLNLRYSYSIIERNSSTFNNENTDLLEIFPIDFVRSSIFYLGLEYNIPVLKKNKN